MNSLHRRLLLPAIMLSLCVSLQLYADQREPTVFDLSLEELLNVKVSIASTKPESISSTPAVTSTYYMRDLMRLGARSLADALSLVPGVVVDEGTYGHTTIMIRGAAELANSEVLFLIDGVPYWSPSQHVLDTCRSSGSY